MERRDSLASQFSSAYTLSRRSSGISPCYSSRRSSQASQTGLRLNNISSADSYDPISTDLSRRSSEASLCEGLPDLLSLTPAQQYRLKAKYAAAIGGAPPTPLPNMERMSLKTRMAFLGDCHEMSLHPLGIPTVPRRSSDTHYARTNMMPHEVAGSFGRRASEPIRREVADQHLFQQRQRFNSMINVNPSQHSPASRHLTMQGHTRSDGNLQHLPPLPRPPSISENMTTETMANDVNGPIDEDLMLPDDMVQYLASNGNLTQPSVSGYQRHQGYLSNGAASPQACFFQRRMAVVDATGNGITRQTSAPCQISPAHQNPALSASKSHMPVQWNEVSSGTIEASSSQTKPQHWTNIPAVQQKQNCGPFQNHKSNQQVKIMSQNLALGVQQRINCAEIPVRQQAIKTEYIHAQHGYHQDSDRNDRQHPSCGNITGGNVGLSSPCRKTLQPVHVQNNRIRTKSDFSQSKTCEDYHGDFTHTGTEQSYDVMNQNHGLLQPRPPTEPKPFGRQHSGSQQPGYPQSHFSPAYASEASPKKPITNTTESSTMFYTGQIHMFETSSFNKSAADAVLMADVSSPGNNQVSSTVDNMEQTQIDFDAILDDADHVSLMSGTFSPSILRNLSQESSRLTTPSNSVTLPSVPAGVGNMAIGDMTSMLTTLAEESKFLNMMS